MPLWTDAYLGDTRHLSTIEHGAYLLLLMIGWRSGGSLPDDDKVLAKYAGLTGGQWKRIAPTIRAFFIVEDGRLVQQRQRDELNHVRQVRISKKAGGYAKSLKTKERHDANAVQMQCVRTLPTPTPTLKEREDKSSLKKPASRSVAWVEGDAIPDEWVQWAMTELRWPAPRAKSEANKFTDYALAHRKTYADWRAAWRGWCRSPYQNKGSANDDSQRKLRV